MSPFLTVALALVVFAHAAPQTGFNQLVKPAHWGALVFAAAAVFVSGPPAVRELIAMVS